MNRKPADDDDYEDDYDEDNPADEDDLEFEPCPHCGADVYEEAEQCPHCGEYITRSTHPFQGRSLTWIILGLLGIIAVLISMFTWLPGM